jgi:hypothetical protein
MSSDLLMTQIMNILFRVKCFSSLTSLIIFYLKLDEIVSFFRLKNIAMAFKNLY